MEEEFLIETKTVSIKDFCKACKLELFYGDIDGELTFTTDLINRPGLLMTGFEEYFGLNRVQIIGNAEHYYINSLTKEDQRVSLNRLFAKKIPCVVSARGIIPNDIALELAKKHNVPMFISYYTTTVLNNVLSSYLENLLAPTMSYHGTLLDISGVGVLITGRSGLGKSETALELVHRGHRLVADDAVLIKKVDNHLEGEAPRAIKFFMEVRGIGIIDVRSMFGVGAVLEVADIDLIIHLDKWKEGSQDYDRLGSNRKVEEIMGCEVEKLVVPVMAGRNLAVIVEVAARNYRLKKFGYDPVKSLAERAKLEK